MCSKTSSSWFGGPATHYKFVLVGSDNAFLIIDRTNPLLLPVYLPSRLLQSPCSVDWLARTRPRQRPSLLRQKSSSPTRQLPRSFWIPFKMKEALAMGYCLWESHQTDLSARWQNGFGKLLVEQLFLIWPGKNLETFDIAGLTNMQSNFYTYPNFSVYRISLYIYTPLDISPQNCIVASQYRCTYVWVCVYRFVHFLSSPEVG